MMARQRRELRISLVVRSDAAPKVLEMLSQVERGRLNGRVIELLNMAVGDAPIPSSSVACLERIERMLQSIKDRIEVVASGAPAADDFSDLLGGGSARRDGAPGRIPRRRSEKIDLDADDADHVPSADAISDAGRLLDNLGVDD